MCCWITWCCLPHDRWQIIKETSMSAFCVFGMTEPLAKTMAAKKAPPEPC